MRTRLLGTIAAVAAGAGGAVGQAPPPMPIGPAGGPGMGVMPVAGASDPIPPPVGMGGMGMGGPMMGGPPGMGGDMGGLMGPGGMPQYPGPGPYGAPPYDSGGAGVNARIAPHVWTDVDFILWFAPGQTVQGPLLTSGPPATRGVLGTTGTSIQSGTTNLGYGAFAGFNIHTGWFYDDAKRHGVELGGFMTEYRTNRITVASDATGQPLYARPFVNLATGLADAALISFPTYASGSATVLATSQSYGAEASFVTNVFRSDPNCGPGKCLWDVNLLGGFRYYSLEEELSVTSLTNILGGQAAPFDGKSYVGPVGIEVKDRFRTANRFYGGQVGIKSAIVCDRWLLQSTLKAAFGSMRQEVTVEGTSTLYAPTTGTTSVVPGGLYANSTNIGKYQNDEFGFIPEVNLNVGRQWTSWFSTHVGYNFLYVNRVARPGNQYVTAVNPATIPTSFSYGLGNNVAVPTPVISQSDFFLQGVSLGFTVRY